jgi:hypothetical protein
MQTAQQLIDGYYRLRGQIPALRDGGDRMQGATWVYTGEAVERRGGGWLLRVYDTDNGIEACLIEPDRSSRTYSTGY